MITSRANAAFFVSAVFVLVVIFLTAAADDSTSDLADAAPLPSIDVRYTSDDCSLTGTGAILDDAVLDVTVNSDRQSKNFFVSGGTVLSAGETYLIITGTTNTTYSLTGSTFNMTPSELVFGLRFSLFTNPSCTGTPVCANSFYDQNTQILSEDLKPGCRYYIMITVDSDATFEEAPYLGYVGFALTASTGPEYNAVYFVSEGVSKGSDLVKNGDQYVFPQVSRSGYDLIGWYDAETGGRCLSNGEPIDQSADLTLYARWSPQDEDHIHYIMPDGSEAYIDKDTEEGLAVVSIWAFSDDGRVTLDIDNVRLSTLTELDYVLHLSSDADSFTEDDSAHCASMQEAIGGWLERNRLTVGPVLNAETAGALRSDAGALKTLSENGFGLKLSNASCKASVYFDDKALGSISDGSGDAGQCTMVIRKADTSDYTKEQADTIGDSEAWLIAVYSGGKEIHDLGGGKASATFPYELEWKSQHVMVDCVGADGGREKVTCRYSDDCTVTVTLGHLSVYMVYGELPENGIWYVYAAAVAAVLISIVSLGVKAAYDRHWL